MKSLKNSDEPEDKALYIRVLRSTIEMGLEIRRLHKKYKWKVPKQLITNIINLKEQLEDYKPYNKIPARTTSGRLLQQAEEQGLI